MYTAARLVPTGRAAVFLRAELPQSKPDGFASSLWEGAFGMVAQFPAQAQSLRACRSPERADFPRPGEDVTAGDKKGNLSRSD